MARDPPTTHRADASALLDDRGYTGALIRGQNPALLFEKAVRDRITESYYWKEQCFGLNTATLCDRAADLTFVGGTYGGLGKPTPFLCLAFKLLQLVPEKNIILEYLHFSDEDEEEKPEDGDAPPEPSNKGEKGHFKYLRALAAFYIRLAWEPVNIYQTLEPLLCDYRKLKRRTREGFALTYMDQLIDDLLTKDRIFATSLWKMPPRESLEDLELLEPRVSPLGDEVDALDEDLDMENGDNARDSEVGEQHDESGSDGEVRERYGSRSRSYSHKSRGGSESRSRSRSRRYRSRSRSSDYRPRQRNGHTSQDRSRSRDSYGRYRDPRSHSRDRYHRRSYSRSRSRDRYRRRSDSRSRSRD